MATSQLIVVTLIVFNVVSQITPSLGISPANNKRDDTIVDKAIGKDVVESVLRKISKSNIFPSDHSFLIRVAYVETQFGQNASTFRAGYYGGIWQVDQSIFQATKNLTVTQFHTQIYQKLGINWTTVQWNQLVKPLYSGVATALYFGTLPVKIPDKIHLQASHWRKYYHSEGLEENFLEACEKLRNNTRCRGKMDLCIVLDSSGSIGSGNYQKALNFTASMITRFTLDYSRIGMLVYSDSVTDIFPINNSLNISQMATAARNSRYISSGTRTDLGILRAVEMFENAGSIEGTPKVMIVFTDGDSNQPLMTLAAIKISKQADIKSMSVGIGDNIKDSELFEIALNDSRSMFRLTDFGALQDFLFTITEVACEVPQKPVFNSTYNDTLISGEVRRYEVELPREGITLNVQVSSGVAKGYWSKTVENPNEAVHDGRIDGPTFIPGNEVEEGEGDVYSHLNAYAREDYVEVVDVKNKSMELSGTVYVTIEAEEGIEEETQYSFTAEVGDTAGLASGGDGVRGEGVVWVVLVGVGLMMISNYNYLN